MTRRFFPAKTRSEGASRAAWRHGRLLLSLLICLLGAAPLRADPARILDLLRIEPLFEILQRESLIYGDDLAAEILDSAEDPRWRAEVGALHAPERLLPPFRAEFTAHLPQASQGAIEDWLSSDLGHKIVNLELSAREAMLEADVEDAAIARAEAADAAGDPRLGAVRALIAAGDLIEANVVGAMNANLAFYRAMAEGGGFPYELTEADMIFEVAAQEPEIRADVGAWIEGYMFLALGPLSEAELAQATDFFASAPGRALIAAQFAGFDRVYVQSSAELGAALARRLRGQKL